MPPREPLIVQVPSAIGMVLDQVRREATLAAMKAGGRRLLHEHIVELTRGLVPDVQFTNRSTKDRLHLHAKVNGETLFVILSKAEKLDIPAGELISFPFVDRKDRIIEVSPVVDEALRRVIRKRLPRIRDEQALNAGLPENTRADRDEGGINFTIEGLSDEGFKRVVEAIRPLINRNRFHRDDPI